MKGAELSAAFAAGGPDVISGAAEGDAALAALSDVGAIRGMFDSPIPGAFSGSRRAIVAHAAKTAPEMKRAIVDRDSRRMQLNHSRQIRAGLRTLAGACYSTFMVWVARDAGRIVVLVVSVSGYALMSSCAGNDDSTGATARVAVDGGGRGGSSGSDGAAASGGSGGLGGTKTGGGPGSGSGGFDPIDCRPVMDEHGCIECARRNCCFDLIACGKDPLCRGTGEFSCISRCAMGAAPDGAVAGDATIARCASTCATTGMPALTTRNLMDCLEHGAADSSTGDNCRLECFGRQ